MQGVGATPATTMTRMTATNEKAKFTMAKRTFSTGNTQRLMRTFLRSEDAPMMEVMPWLVESLMSWNVMLPRMI